MNIVIPHGFEPNYTVGYVKGLIANGLQVTVISSDADHSQLIAIGAGAVNLRGAQETGRGYLKKFANLLRYYFRLVLFLLRNRGSVVHFTGLFRNELLIIDALLLNWTFRLLARRYLYTVHNVLPHSKERSRLYRWVYRFAYRVPHVILVHTDLARTQLLSQFSVPHDRIRVISIGLNEEIPMTSVSQADARRALALPVHGRVILFFGKADIYKGLDTLIAAFDLLESDDTALLIAAWFPDSAYRSKVTRLVHNARRRSDIHFHDGFTPNERVELYFKSADVLCLPYHSIYQSGVLFLALAFGLPIVATAVGSLPEYIDDETGLIAEPGNPASLAAALRKVIADAPLRFDRARIAECARRRFAWSTICCEIAGLYDSPTDVRATK
jgi:glycosyltransferase involved in cell wall biosynthesis